MESYPALHTFPDASGQYLHKTDIGLTQNFDMVGTRPGRVGRELTSVRGVQ